MEQFKTTYADVDQLRKYSFLMMYVAVMNDKLITGEKEMVLSIWNQMALLPEEWQV